MKPITSLSRILALSVFALGLAGCATAVAPSAAISAVPVTFGSGTGAAVKSATIKAVGGRLYATGNVELTESQPGNSGIQVEARLLDSAGRELARKINSVPLHGRTARVHQLSPYWVPLDPWPDGTANVNVMAYLHQ
jgi:hypothetical protein